MTVNCRHARIENIMTLRFPNIQQVNNCVLMQQENLYLYFANITSKFKMGLTNPSQQYCYGGKPFLEHSSSNLRHSYTKPSPIVWPLV
jgi:hypothetical protein